ncbi:ApeA N-terminal domain 1-containing protein [Variovorax boronicumulans]|uniref:ApeA N-terminal domain 1-containing protein n=1 Tax=Variovorax boronicumulans TaxID=436515 RepID=UPI001C5618FA
MRQSSDSDYQRTLRVRLSHPEVGDLGEGSITFGYSCVPCLVLDGFGHGISLSEAQLAEGLLAQADDGTRLSLFNCDCSDRTLFPAFVIDREIKTPEFLSFEVRYSNVSEWFFQQMAIEGNPGEKLEWCSTPKPLVAEVSVADHHFRVSSFYVGTFEHQGEDRNLHQHFEFRFTATQGHFSLSEVRERSLRFSNLLSILLGHHCSIVSIDVSANGKHSSRLFCALFKSPPDEEASQDDRMSWRKFFAQKSDVEDCWDNVVNQFFRSAYQEVIWSRVAGMQNWEGFWEYRVLGYVSLLDSYVSQTFKKGPPTQPTKRLLRLATELNAVRPPLSPAQLADVLKAATQVFSSNDAFASKFQELIDTLDPDVLKVINLSQADFETIKKLRNEVAHGQQLSFKGPDITPIEVITNRITLLLTHLFFIDLGLGRDVFLGCLARPLNKLRIASDVNQVHLDRTLKPTSFFQVTSQALQAIRQRSRRLLCSCFVRDRNGAISYSASHSEEIQSASRASGKVRYHELLCLPEEAVTFVGDAYFEDGAQIESIHSTVLIDLAFLPN